MPHLHSRKSIASKIFESTLLLVFIATRRYTFDAQDQNLNPVEMMKAYLLIRPIICVCAGSQILLLSGCGGMLFEEFRKRGEFLGSSSSLSFDSKFWKKDKKMRSQMCSMLPIKLKGLKDTEVEELLGPPDERSGQNPSLKEPDCMAYEMQDKNGKIAMYLLIFLTDRIVERVEMGLPK